jgi:hypothetical protein
MKGLVMGSGEIGNEMNIQVFVEEAVTYMHRREHWLFYGLFWIGGIGFF